MGLIFHLFVCVIGASSLPGKTQSLGAYSSWGQFGVRVGVTLLSRALLHFPESRHASGSSP